SLLPGRRTEDWRWSDLKGVVRAVPPPSPAAATPASPPPLAELAADNEIVVVNGRSEVFGFHAVAGLPRTLRLRIVSSADQTAHQGVLTLDVEPGAELTLIETYEGDGAGYLSDFSLAVSVGEGAKVERIVLLDEPADAVSISQSQVELQAGAWFGQTVVAAGAKLQRHETQLRHPGRGAEVRLDGLYLLNDRRHADLTTVVDHSGVDGVTTQLTKGLAKDQARGVFQGRIVVEEGADRTDARMGHHALLLNDGAEIDAKPELEIYADDVSCAHGNTVGSLDEDALFYMRARGIPEPEARALLMEAFVGEVVDRIRHEGARAAVHAWVSAKLRALS
ncbi:MAG: Fe-S cluster assembly protein SufD, partial [Caulobacteraceae bacterium]